jgi:hypothetical protein
MLYAQLRASNEADTLPNKTMSELYLSRRFDNDLPFLIMSYVRAIEPFSQPCCKGLGTSAQLLVGCTAGTFFFFADLSITAHFLALDNAIRICLYLGMMRTFRRIDGTNRP